MNDGNSGLHPAEIIARKLEWQAAKAARRGDGRGAEDACRRANAIRRTAGLPLPRIAALAAAIRVRP